MRATIFGVLALACSLSACGSTPQRAAMPDVASTDQSADEMGLPSADGDAAEDAPTEALEAAPEAPSPES